MTTKYITVPRFASKRTKNLIRLERFFNFKFDFFWRDFTKSIVYRKHKLSKTGQEFVQLVKQNWRENLWELVKNQYYAETDYLGRFKPNKFIEKGGELCIQFDEKQRMIFVITFVFTVPDIMVQSSEMLSEGIKKISMKESGELSGEIVSLNRILEVAQTKLKTKRKVTIDIARKIIPEIDRIVRSEAEECRRPSGKINFSQLGISFNINHKTAKRWCQKIGIPLTRPSIN